MTTVRNDHVDVCNMAEQIQMGEKIKIILGAFDNKTKSFSSEYQEFEPEKIKLLITWFVDETREKVINFIFREFRISVSLQKDDHSVLIINLCQITGGLISHINKYLSNSLPDEKGIKLNRIEYLVDGIISRRSNKSIIVSKLDLKKEKNFNLAKSDVKTENPPISSSSTEVVDTAINKKTIEGPKKENMVKYIQRYRESLGLFMTHLSMFENNFATSKLIDLHNLFTYDNCDDVYLQVLKCKDNYTALNIERVIRWQLDYYKDSKSLFRDGNFVMVDCSLCFNREIKKKSTGGSFCFPPNDVANISEIRGRMHRVSYLPKDLNIEPSEGCFIITYPTNRKAEGVHFLISRMGWTSELCDNKVIIVTDSKLNSSSIKKEIEVKSEPKVEKTKGLIPESKELKVKQEVKSQVFEEEKPKIEKVSLVEKLKKANSIYPVCEVACHKKEAIEKLQNMYLDQKTFLTFSIGNQQKITSVLHKFWTEEHPEDYAMKLVDYLEKN